MTTSSKYLRPHLAALVGLALLFAADVSMAKPTRELPSEPEQSSEPTRGRGSSTDRKARPLGLGVILGNPTAVGLRYWTSRDMALQAWLGGAPGFGGVYLGGDVIFVIASDLLKPSASAVQLDLWLGGGAAIGGGGGDGSHCHREGWKKFCHSHSGSDLYLAARVPLGASLWLRGAPGLELFIEVAPGLIFLPFVWMGFDGGMGARFYF